MKIELPLDHVSPTRPIAWNGADPYISQTYYENANDYAQFGLKSHAGVDIAAPKGTPVYARKDGWIVESVQKDTGFGLRVLYIFLEDGFYWEVTNGHFERTDLPELPYNIKRITQPVKKGDIIGYVDSTGFSTGNHDHYGLRQYDLNYKLLNYNNGNLGYIDPLKYLKDSNMNQFVQTMNFEGTVGVFIPVSDPSQIELLNNIYNLDLKVETDGQIKTDLKVRKA